MLPRPLLRSFCGKLHPKAQGLMWLVWIVQNLIVQLATDPFWQRNEIAFNTYDIYYVLLFIVTGVIVFRLHSMQAQNAIRDGAVPSRS
jgi:hypothetical protein